MRLDIHPKVPEEAEEAIFWYETQRIGLGDAFLSELRSAFALLKRFPYDILYYILPGRIRVLCVRHVKRHQRYGMGRR